MFALACVYGYVPFLFINRQTITWTDELICGAIWICGLSHFINHITSLRKWMLNDYKSTAQNRNNAIEFTYMYV